MHFSRPLTSSGRTDVELVGDSLAGDRNAFEEIVGRYQTLVCSLAYSATGDLARSEDLAQDTFLAAWRQLRELREPEKLRAWICGIVRNRIHDSVRSQSREPVDRAATLDQAAEMAAPEAQPSEQAASRDETAIMWRALEQIPEAYREPLILFHRENQSVERVAESLELSEDTVKQRLVRGRKMLQSEVEKVVEGALRRTAPGRAFTSSVMGTLPATAAMKAAAGGAAAAKGAVGGGMLGVITAIMTSPIAPIAIVWLGRKLRLAAEKRSPSAEERELRKQSRREFTVGILAMAAYMEVWMTWYKHVTAAGHHPPPWYAPLFALVVVAFFPILWARQHRIKRRIWDVWARTGTAPARLRFEFRSRRALFGWPLLHVRIGSNPAAAENRTPVKAWVAVGDIAHGIFFACGNVAIAPFSIGMFGMGLVCVGVFSAGGLALGVTSMGLLGLGFFAFGWMAKGVIAFGVRAAYGLQAYARTYAGFPTRSKGAAAHALHANDAAAGDFFDHDRFFSWTRIGRQEFEHLLIMLLCAAIVCGTVEICWNIWRQRQSGR
ncbi:MAG: sigma-70 family RNA polymerase sigma factor [Opitutaceae bacterium]